MHFFLPSLPLHLKEQQSRFSVQDDPPGKQSEQSGSLRPSQLGPQQPSAHPHSGKVFSHRPSKHKSSVQESPSSQFIGSKKHVPPEQLSAVQESPSSQVIGVLKQVPLMHRSVVQASKSLHSPLSIQPPAPGSHTPSTQTSPSEHLTSKYQHTPLRHQSVVHRLKSLQSL